MQAPPGNIHNLGPFFHPHRIALLGVTANPNAVGGRTLANLVTGGFQGVVYPIHPTLEAVLGVPCFPSLEALSKPPDLAIVCTPAEQVPDTVSACGRAGVGGVLIMSSGFKESGAAGAELERRLRAAAAPFPRLRILGPNCLGILVPGHHLNASFAAAMPKAGHIGFLSQSGALCTAVLDHALEANIGFSAFVSIGNTCDIDFGDLIDYLGEDPDTRSIILYVESVRDARRFMTAARAFARGKPILVYKAGRFPESAQVAASHTGALVTEDAVYDAAFQRAGLARVYDIGDIFDCAELIGRGKMPGGPRLGIVTNAGGPGVMATDALIELGGTLAQLTPATMQQLHDNLPPAWSRQNPVDVLGDCPPKRLEKAAQLVLQDAEVDALLVILTPQAMTSPTGTARLVGKLTTTTHKPILAAWLGGQSMREGIRVLLDAGVAAYQTPEQAIRSFMTLVAYARNLRLLFETPKDFSVELPQDRQPRRAAFAARHFGGADLLSEDVAKALLEDYGIATTRPQLATSAELAVALAERIGYPVVLKIASPDISHKSDVGGVALDVADAESVRGAFLRILTAAQNRRPDAHIDGVTVQPFVDGKDGVELILGIKKDPVFGTVLMAGMGGIGVELFGDRALALPPLNERLARRMLESLKVWPLLSGYRGRPPVAVDRLLEVLIRLSYLAADYPEIAELDINPLLVTPRDVTALDARATLDRAAIQSPREPFAHLALRPYPAHYRSTAQLRDGTKLVLRPIKPEDEPLWLELLRSCSKESLYSRFRSLFHWDNHEVATRYCYIDYDREIAIVAEACIAGVRQLLGVGRLIADPDHEEVEYAVLVADAWQKREIGALLTDRCIDIARHWQLDRIVATTTTSNRPMISVFQKRNFRVEFAADELVEVSLQL